MGISQRTVDKLASALADRSAAEEIADAIEDCEPADVAAPELPQDLGASSSPSFGDLTLAGDLDAANASLSGDLDANTVNALTEVQVGGIRVVGEQLPAIADIVEGEEVAPKVHEILAAMRAHGLIASS